MDTPIYDKLVTEMGTPRQRGLLLANQSIQFLANETRKLELSRIVPDMYRLARMHSYMR